jgi:metallo-beta-lactamase class B
MRFREKLLLRVTAFLAVILSLATLHAQNPADWTTPQKPFRITGNLYYVGSRDLAAYLVTTPAGNILINANLETSPPQIRASVEALGFRWADTKILLNSQAHFDHTGGAAAILKQTGAKFVVMEGDAAVAESGGRAGYGNLPSYPPAHVDRVLHDGDKVELGGVTLIAHKTAGHTRGCTTWTMQVKNEKGHTLNVVIVGGFSILDDYRLIDIPGHQASYPGIAKDYAHGFAVLQSLPCDIFLGAHGIYFNMQEKLAKLPTEGESVWIDPEGYQQAILEAKQKLEQRLKEEKEQARRAATQS